MRLLEGVNGVGGLYLREDGILNSALSASQPASLFQPNTAIYLSISCSEKFCRIYTPLALIILLSILSNHFVISPSTSFSLSLYLLDFISS